MTTVIELACATPTITDLYERYIALYGEMEAPGYTDGEADTNELCQLATTIAAIPATTQAERNLKSVIATLEDRSEEILASLERDYAQAA